MRSVRLFTIAFGDRYLDWFDRACARSLEWPDNKRQIQERVEAWDIWAPEKDAKRALGIAARLGIPVVHHPKVRGDLEENNLFKALIGQMGLCADKSAFIFAAPDNIFGDGSIRTLLDIGSVPGICVAVPTLRVAEEGFLEAMPDGPMKNAELVKFSMPRVHQAFLDGDVTKPSNNGWISGVTWRPLADGLYAVTHRMPSSYLMQPKRTDVKWFLDRPKFGCYDHQMPQILVNQERQRVVGSSDAAFMVELTTKDTWCPPLYPTDSANPDRYRGDLSHHVVNRNVVCIWRAG